MYDDVVEAMYKAVKKPFHPNEQTKSSQQFKQVTFVWCCCKLTYILAVVTSCAGMWSCSNMCSRKERREVSMFDFQQKNEIVVKGENI